MFFIILDNQASTIIGNNNGLLDQKLNNILCSFHKVFLEANIQPQFIWARRTSALIIIADSLSKLFSCPFNEGRWRESFVTWISKTLGEEGTLTQEITTIDFWNSFFFERNEKKFNAMRKRKSLFILPHDRNECGRLIHVLKVKKAFGSIIGPYFHTQPWLKELGSKSRLSIFRWSEALEEVPDKFNHFNGFCCNFNFTETK